MRQICFKMIRGIIQTQQQEWRNLATNLLEQAKFNLQLQSQVINGSDSWFFHYDSETECQSLQWNLKRSVSQCLNIDDNGIPHHDNASSHAMLTLLRDSQTYFGAAAASLLSSLTLSFFVCVYS